MADVHEGHRAADHPGDFLQLYYADHQAFQEFTGPYVITGGGPTYYTYLFSLYIYDTAFKYFDMGYGAALAWVLFLVVAVFASIAFKSSKYWVFYSADKGRQKWLIFNRWRR